MSRNSVMLTDSVYSWKGKPWCILSYSIFNKGSVNDLCQVSGWGLKRVITYLENINVGVWTKWNCAEVHLRMSEKSICLEGKIIMQKWRRHRTNAKHPTWSSQCHLSCCRSHFDKVKYSGALVPRVRLRWISCVVQFMPNLDILKTARKQKNRHVLPLQSDQLFMSRDALEFRKSLMMSSHSL